MDKQNKPSTIWFYTRVSFWLMIMLWIVSGIIESLATIEFIESTRYLIFSLFFVGFVISTFVLSIIHLTKYREKGLAITGLVISSIGLLFVFMGFLLLL